MQQSPLPPVSAAPILAGGVPWSPDTPHPPPSASVLNHGKPRW